MAASAETTGDNRFRHFNSIFDAEGLIHSFAVPNLHPDPSFVTNFLGVRVDPKFAPSILTQSKGTVEPPPIPANWHADMAEWAAVLQSVEAARDTYAVVELGCGWGCWINNTALAARARGLEPRLIGVEADEGHLRFAQEACAANGIPLDQVTLHRGIVAAGSGVALFPRQSEAGSTYALSPIFGATDAEQDRHLASGQYEKLPMLSLAEVIGDGRKLDLLHVDIQGGEVDLIRNTLATLNDQVARLVIGTHSREIEGLLFALLLDAGWFLEIERPAWLDLRAAKPIVWVDGVQGWRNPRLATV